MTYRYVIDMVGAPFFHCSILFSLQLTSALPLLVLFSQGGEMQGGLLLNASGDVDAQEDTDWTISVRLGETKLTNGSVMFRM